MDEQSPARGSHVSENGDIVAERRDSYELLNFRKFNIDMSKKQTKLLILQFSINGDNEFREMLRSELYHNVRDTIAESSRISDTKEGKGKPENVSDAKAGPVGKITLGAGGREGVGQRGQLHSRDIRQLDESFAMTSEPVIIVRRNVILINMDPFRAIILRDRCLLLVPDGADSLLSVVKEKLNTPPREGFAEEGMPFEFRALEAILESVTRMQSQEVEDIKSRLGEVLILMRSQSTSGALERLRALKNEIDSLLSKVSGTFRALKLLLDEDDDMVMMYLTRAHLHPSMLDNLSMFEPEEAEFLLENYSQDVQSILSRLKMLELELDNTESLVQMQLDAARNRLLSLDLFFSLLTAAMTVAAVVAGIFGMNLRSNHEDSNETFELVVWLIVAGCGLSMLVGFIVFKRMKLLMY